MAAARMKKQSPSIQRSHYLRVSKAKAGKTQSQCQSFKVQTSRSELSLKPWMKGPLEGRSLHVKARGKYLEEDKKICSKTKVQLDLVLI